VGKRDDEKTDEDLKPDPESRFIDADRRRNISQRTKTKRSSAHQSLDIAALGEAFASAHEKGASTSRAQTDVLVDALEAAHKTIKAKDDLLTQKDEVIQKLIAKVASAAEANITSMMLDGKARLDETEAREKWLSIRTAITTLGPGFAPIIQRVTPLLLPAAGDAADKGDRSPRSCAIRVFSKLQDGSAESMQLVGILEMFAGDDWPGLLLFLAEIANAPAPSAPATH
jgi:hypothetical protein